MNTIVRTLIPANRLPKGEELKVGQQLKRLVIDYHGQLLVRVKNGQRSYWEGYRDPEDRGEIKPYSVCLIEVTRIEKEKFWWFLKEVISPEIGN
jgi:hypothetical protein